MNAVTEAGMLRMLHRRYNKTGMGARRFAVAEHVGNHPGGASRTADFMAVDCYNLGGAFARRGEHEVIGHEVKVSRSDWLTELRDPSKAEAFRPYCHSWWLVVSDRSIVREGELPTGWGLLARFGSQLRVVFAAPVQTPAPMPSPMFASLCRAIAKTAATAAMDGGASC